MSSYSKSYNNNNEEINNNINSNNSIRIKSNFIRRENLDELELESINDNLYKNNNKILSDIVFNNNMNNLNKKDLKRVDIMVKDKLNLMDSNNAVKLAKVKNGYKSYENRTVLGDLSELLTADSLNEVLVNKLFNQFEVNKGYTLLFQLDYFNNGKLSALTPMKSMHVTFDTNMNLISGNVINAMNKLLNEYTVDVDTCKLSVIWRD